MSQTLRLLLIRHGEAEHNLRTSGWRQIFDPKLTERGVAQFRELGERMRDGWHESDVLVVSPLLRTLQSASLLVAPLDAADADAARPARVIASADVQEINRTPCDTGRHWTELERDIDALFTGAAHEPLRAALHALHAADEHWFTPSRKLADGGDMYLPRRIERFKASVAALADAPSPPRRVVVVTHHGFLRTLLPEAEARDMLDNACTIHAELDVATHEVRMVIDDDQ